MYIGVFAWSALDIATGDQQLYIARHRHCGTRPRRVGRTGSAKRAELTRREVRIHSGVAEGASAAVGIEVSVPQGRSTRSSETRAQEQAGRRVVTPGIVVHEHELAIRLGVVVELQ